jgi:hypothetical protein
MKPLQHMHKHHAVSGIHKHHVMLPPTTMAVLRPDEDATLLLAFIAWQCRGKGSNCHEQETLLQCRCSGCWLC